MARVSRIIWVEDDDGSVSLESIPGVTKQEIFQASIIITDKGRILKHRSGRPWTINQSVPSFDLVKQADKPLNIPAKKTKTKYRSIYDPMDVQADL